VSRHRWNTHTPADSGDHSSEAESDYPSIFAATLHVVREQAGQSTSSSDREEPKEASPLVWRPARSSVDPPPDSDSDSDSEEVTVEIPHIDNPEPPAVPALALLSLGRHSMR